MFTGKPDWHSLLINRNTGLTDKEQTFVDNQCNQALAMCNAWDVAVERADLPEELWDFLKREKFFGMIILKNTVVWDSPRKLRPPCCSAWPLTKC